jgi:hypothetical protein
VSVESADTAAAEEGPVVVHWVGARFVTAGAKIYPQPDSPIIQEFNKALNIDLRAVKVDAFSAEEMNLLFATGEIPDHILASQNNMLRYQDEGLLRGVAVLVAVVAAGVTTAGLVVSGFRRLADQVATGDQRLADQIATVDQRLTDQIAAGDQRLADRLAGVEQRLSFLAGLVKGKQRAAPAPGPGGG